MISKKQTMLFISGFQSSVPSTKSNYLEQFCQSHDLTLLTFNHDFSSETYVGTWYKNLLHILINRSEEAFILVCSSLGLWLALLLFNPEEADAIKIRSRVIGILGIGSSINSAEVCLNEIESEEKRIDRTYVYRRSSQYSTTGFCDIPVSMLLDSKKYLLATESKKISVGCSMIMLHGMIDIDVPYQRAIDLFKLLDVPMRKICELRIIHDGDHRLSRHENLLRIGIGEVKLAIMFFV